MKLIESLRSAARSPESWDIPGLLEDAALKLAERETGCVTITVEGGVVQDVDGLPAGWHHEIIDLDDDDTAEEWAAEEILQHEG